MRTWVPAAVLAATATTACGGGSAAPTSAPSSVSTVTVTAAPVTATVTAAPVTVTATAQALPARTVTAKAEPAETVTVTRRAAAPAADEEPAAAAGDTIPGDGVHLVGSDVKPGRYRSTGNDGCYWARLKGTGGDFEDIIANANVDGSAVVSIARSDEAFETTNCNDWKKVS